MKKRNILTKSLSVALMLVMLVSLASVGISADKVEFLSFGNVPLFQIFLPDQDFLAHADMSWIETDYSQDIVISGDTYDKYIQPFTGDYRDITLELAGVKLGNVPGGFTENLSDKAVIEAMPEENAPYEEWVEWLDNNFDHDYMYQYDEYGYIIDRIELINPLSVIMTYVMHKHDLAGSQMYFDDNYHWQLCTECANRVYLANHTDKDNDGKCDFCGNAIRYYNVTVKDTTGGKVTLSANKGAMNGKIGVTVTPDAGYHLEALNFVNANAMHSKRAVWEDTPNAEYHFFIANWDVEVEAIFVKD